MSSSTVDEKRAIISADDAVLSQIGAMIQQVEADPSLELEARLGQMDDSNRFHPGVTRAHMDQLIRGLDMLLHEDVAQEHIGTRDSAWEEEENYYYTHGKRALRTRVVFDAKNVRIVPHTIEKTTLQSIVLKTHVMDVRVSLAREQPVLNPPHVTATRHVRIKQRRSFQFRKSPFTLDCGMVWSGVTKTDVERCQQEIEPIFEVECELDRERLGLWTSKYGDDRCKMARSFLYKVSDMMMTTGVRFCQK